MNKIFFAFALMVSGILIPSAQAIVKIHPHCQQGFRQDSVGRGIEGGFTGQNLMPSPGDQACYDFGVSDVQELASNDQICMTKFNAGKMQGLIEAGNSDTAQCFSFGYMAGVASLHVAARSGAEGESPRGQECLKAYQTGWNDSAGHGQQNSGNDHLRSDCYLTGFYDQQQLHSL